ncbi:MAG: hypothetical protein Q6370_005750 [Candidatus Sigynarchaeota archaeon]
MAILLASGTADQLNAALDEKLAAMPGIYYRVVHARAPGLPPPRPPSVTRAAPGNGTAATAATTTPPPSPVLVHPSCPWKAAILASLAARGIDARVDGAMPGELALPGGIGVRIINQNDAAGYDASIAVEELPGVARRAVIVLPEAGSVMDTGVLQRLSRALAPEGIDVSCCYTHEAIVEKIVKGVKAKSTR